jgi:HSP20 family protein
MAAPGPPIIQGVFSHMERPMTNITRYNPFEDFFADFPKGFLVRPFPAAAGAELQMKIDVKEDDKAFTIKADIPGVKKEDIHVDVEGDQVTLRAETKTEKEEKKGEKVIYSERSFGALSRSFSLPVDVDEKGARAEYKDGVLNLILPKKANGSARRIEVS